MIRQIEDELAKPAMKAAIASAMDAGEIERRVVEPVAHLIFAALCEAAMQMDRADNFDAAQIAWIAELRRMLDGLH